MKKNYPDMHIFDETDKYFIGHIYENGYLVDKRNGEEILLGGFYGDPACGLLSKQNEWAIMAGEYIAIWNKGKVIKIEDEEVKWIFAIREINNRIVKFLIDPWSEKSSIWQLHLDNLSLAKIRDFNDYKGKEFTEDVIW